MLKYGTSWDRRPLRYEVPVDGGPHVIAMEEEAVLHCAATWRGTGSGRITDHTVEFWAEGGINSKYLVARTFQVFGTAHELPDSAVWRGTTQRTPDGLVWHLYEILKEEEK